MPEGSTKNAAALGFIPYGNGYEYTESARLIAARLAMVRDQRIPVVVVHDKYQSGPCILVTVGPDSLEIDRPRDWPGTSTKIRVIFRDPHNLWNHFYCTVTRTSRDSLFTTLPQRFFLLQRRQHYRVLTPSGSLVSFVYKERLYDDFTLRDLSAGGLCMGRRQPLEFPPRARITDLVLFLPRSDGDPLHLRCRAGEVLRSAYHRPGKLHLYGVKFDITAKEEDALIHYVRQRELEILRQSQAAAQ